MWNHIQTLSMCFVDFVPEAQLSDWRSDMKLNWQIFGFPLYEATLVSLIAAFSIGHHVHFLFDQDTKVIH